MDPVISDDDEEVDLDNMPVLPPPSLPSNDSVTSKSKSRSAKEKPAKEKPAASRRLVKAIEVSIY